MKMSKFLSLAIIATFFYISPLFAQSNPRQQPNPAPTIQTQEYPTNFPIAPNSTDVLANEVSQLRKSLQALNKKLGEIGEKFVAPDAKQAADASRNQQRILLNLDVLSRAEQRAEVLRKQLIELVEKENSIKSRVIQIEEDMRPENVERATVMMGSTRAPEQRDARKRALESERNGLQSLLNQIYQSRNRLEGDVREADDLVVKLRQRVLPVIEKEIQNINPN